MEVFDAAFYPAIGHSKRYPYPRLVYFYDKVFPGLDFLTEKRPEAVPLVNQIIKDGHDVVEHTINPLYPRTATCHRIHWAGFPVDENLSAVTTYEDYHFAKPNPAYFVEILGRLGFPKIAAMIGNSLEEDILPAELLGIPTFWLPESPTRPCGSAESGSARQEPCLRLKVRVEKAVWKTSHISGCRQPRYPIHPPGYAVNP